MSKYRYTGRARGSPAWQEVTWPSACMPLLPQQICVGPYRPCSVHCRHGWWHLRISATACKDSWPPKWFLRKDVRCSDGILIVTHFSKFLWYQFCHLLNFLCDFGQVTQCFKSQFLADATYISGLFWGLDEMTNGVALKLRRFCNSQCKYHDNIIAQNR